MAIKKINTDLQIKAGLLDSEGDLGAANQVLISTSTGVNWVDGSASSIIGGPYLPLTGGTIDGQILISNTFPVLDFIDTNSFADPNDRFRIRAGGTQGLMQWYDDSNSSLLTLMTLNPNGDVIVPNGNVGIGTTSPQQKLHVAGNGRFESGATGLGGYVTVGNPQETAGNYSAYFFGNTTHDNIYMKGAIAYETLSTTNGRGDMHFLQNSSANGTNASISDSVMTILNSGKVGIGTTNPSAKLHIVNEGEGEFAGGNSSTAGGSHLMLKDEGGTSRNLMSGPSIVFQTPANADGTNIWATSRLLGSPAAAGSARGTFSIQVRDQYDPLNDGTSWNWRTVLTAINSGNVGIGTTSPEVLLDVNKATIGEYAYFGSGLTRQLRLSSYNTVSDHAGHKIDASSGNGEITLATGGTSRLVVKSTGNVGIGTTSPDSKLDVRGSSAVPADGNQTLSITNTTGGTQLNLGTAENAYGWIEAREGNASRNLLINPNGSNVGIGTTSPEKTLDVFGTGRFYDDLSLSENLKMDNRQTGVVTSSQPRIRRAVLESSIETGNAVVHPYFNNDLANFVARGGNVIVGGVTTEPSDAAKNVMFQPSNQFMGVSGITGSTWSITLLSAGDAAFNLSYGCYIGITFGSGSFDPDSIIIEGTTDSTGATGWTTALNSSVSGTTYSTYLSSGGNGIKAIRFTMGYTSGGPRVNNIFAYNYASKGMTNYFLGKDGGKVYGNIETTSFGLSAAVNLINNSGDSYFNGGNVGIGTTNPETNLMIYDTVDEDPAAPGSPTTGMFSLNTGGQATLSMGVGSNNAFWMSNVNRAFAGPYYYNILLNPLGGKVGIGTTNPDSLLHIKGADPVFIIQDTSTGTVDASSTLRLGESGAGGVLDVYWDIKQAADNLNTHLEINHSTNGNHLTILDGGNVGIGETNPSQKLHVGGSAKLETVSSTTPTLDLVSYNDTDPFLRHYDINAGTTWCTGLDVSDEKYKISFGYDNDTVSSGTKLTIATNGDVGIGTTSPSSQLNVHKNALSPAVLELSNAVVSGNNGVVIAQIKANTVTEELTRIETQNSPSSHDDGNLLFYNRNGYTNTFAESMRITGEGNVGIGTDSPSAKLHVTGEIRAYNSANTHYTNLNANSSWGYVNTNAPKIYISNEIRVDSGLIGSYDEALQLRTSGTTRMYINNSSGNVGIGTTNPQAKLQVSNSGESSLDIEDTGGQKYRLFSRNSDKVFGIYDVSNPKTWFRYTGNSSASSTKLAILEGGGNVGIGTTTPSQKLYVSGNIFASGNLYVGSSSNFVDLEFGYMKLQSSNGVLVQTGSTFKPIQASAFTIGSDYRLKSNVVPLENAIDRVNQLNVHRFNWNDRLDEAKVDGFIAHEVAEVIPEAVIGEKDAVREDGTPNYQGIDQAKIVPLLTAALQEALEKINQLETRIQTLENNN